jgi:hypothetical protein
VIKPKRIGCPVGAATLDELLAALLAVLEPVLDAVLDALDDDDLLLLLPQAAATRASTEAVDKRTANLARLRIASP